MISTSRPKNQLHSIERRSLGEVSKSWAEEQLAIFKRAVREGNYEKKKPRVKEVQRTIADLWKIYLGSYRLAGKRAEWRQAAAWKHLKPVFETMRPEQLTRADLIGYQTERCRWSISGNRQSRSFGIFGCALSCGEDDRRRRKAVS